LAFAAIVSLQVAPAFADPATIQVTPGPANVLVGTTQAFKAQAYDANGNLLATQPSWTWSVSGGGTIDTYGNLTAPNSPATVTVTATSGSATGTASVAVVGGTDSLTGTASSSTAAINFTTGDITGDWIHFGRAIPGIDQRAVAGAAVGVISSYTKVGSGTVGTYRTDTRLLSWTDGTPTASNSGSAQGVEVGGSGGGFQITCPAGPSQGVLTVCCGGLNCGGTLTAHLSSGTVADYTATTTNQSGLWDEVFTIDVSSASANQTLTVKWMLSAGTGAVTLAGAKLVETGM
jgi:hypothetical protein